MKFGDTEARRAAMVRRQPVDRQRAESAARAFGEQPGGGQIGSRQDDGELLAADAAGDMVAGGRLAQETGKGLDDPIAGGMAETVVDALEMVEVGDDQRDRHALPHGASATLARAWRSKPPRLSRPDSVSVSDFDVTSASTSRTRMASDQQRDGARAKTVPSDCETSA